MTLLAKNKFSHYRRFEIDIWGVCFNDARARKVKKTTTVGQLHTKRQAIWLASRKRYIYRLDLLPPDRPKKRLSRRFVSIRLTRLYFITLQDHHFGN